MKLQRAFDWSQWRRRYRNGPHTAGRSGNTPYEICHSRGPQPSLQLAFSVTWGFRRTNDLSLKDQVHADLHYWLKVFLRVVGGSWSRNWSIWGWGIWRSHITWCGSYFSGTHRLFWKAGLTELGGTFLQKRAPYAISAELSTIRLTELLQTGWLIRRVLRN